MGVLCCSAGLQLYWAKVGIPLPGIPTFYRYTPADPRLVELTCLKNRYGRSSYSCGFNYYPKFDLFIPQDDFGALLDDSETPYGIYGEDNGEGGDEVETEEEAMEKLKAGNKRRKR